MDSMPRQYGWELTATTARAQYCKLVSKLLLMTGNFTTTVCSKSTTPEYKPTVNLQHGGNGGLPTGLISLESRFAREMSSPLASSSSLRHRASRLSQTKTRVKALASI